MKILIYGAGVLGSYLAHSLFNSDYDVTMLARGKRVEELSKGLEIIHVLQRHDTVDKIVVVESLKKEDFYDIIFVVMQANQIESVYQPIIENEQCPLVIFVGNNIAPEITRSTILNASKIEREVLFAFLSVGGRRKKGKIISLHLENPTMHVGTVVEMENLSLRKKMDEFFIETRLSYRWYDNMESYLKTHIAFIMPLGYLAYISNFKLHRYFFKGEYLKAVILAMKEGFDALEKVGIKPLIPEELQPVFKSRLREQLFIRFIIMPPVGRLAICDHCRASKLEMDFLEVAMLDWLKKSEIELVGYKLLSDKLKNGRV